MLIEWKDDYLVDNPILDEQHRGLVSTINSLQYFIDEDWDVDNLRPTIGILANFVKFHFKTEEMILAFHELPEDKLANVIKYHKDFVKQLNTNADEAIYLAEPQKLTNFLREWWLGHKPEYHDKLSDHFDPNASCIFSP